MGPRRRMLATPLDWGALLAGLMAISWAIGGPLVSIAILTGIAAFVLFFVALGRVTGPARTALALGSGLGLAFLAVWSILFLLSLPIKFGRDPDTGVLSEGGAGLQDFALLAGPVLLNLTAVAVVVALFLLWTPRERILGIAGVAVIVAVQVASPLVESRSDVVSILFMTAFAVGFVAVAAACLLPVFLPPDDDRWTAAAAPPPQAK